MIIELDIKSTAKPETGDAQFENIDASESLGNKYILEEKKKLLNWIKMGVEYGYNIYSNIEDIEELIDIIVNWYKFKYPINIVKMSEKNLQQRLRAEKISDYMGYTDLMFRIPMHLHPIVECWYKDDEGRVVEDFLETKIYTTNTLKPVIEKLEYDNYDGIISSDRFILEIFGRETDGLSFKCSTIEEFISINENNSNFNLECPKMVVATHKYDLETRNKIFYLIALKLIYSDKDIRYGYVLAKKFIEEFNKYIYNLNLKEDYLYFNNLYDVPKEISDSILQTDRNVTDDIKQDLKVSKFNSIEEYGLSFKTLCNLKGKGINNIDNPLLEKFYEVPIFNFYMPDRDIAIINKIIEQQRLLKKNEMSESKAEIVNEEKKAEQNTEGAKVHKKSFLKKLFK